MLIKASKSEYRDIILKYHEDRVYLLYQESKHPDYDGDVHSGVHGDSYVSVRCHNCWRKQTTYCNDSYESFCGGAYFHCKFCEYFNGPDKSYWIAGKIFEYSGFMCLNNDYDKTKYTRCKKRYKKYYKEMRLQLYEINKLKFYSIYF